MHNKTWKKERDLLREAYQTIAETTHENDSPALGPDEERQADGSIKNTKTGEIVYTPKGKKETVEAIDAESAVELANADRPAADDNLEMEPGELPDDIPHEAQALLDELKAPSFDLETLARERRLSDYIKFLNTLLQGAEEFNSLKQPQETINQS